MAAPAAGNKITAALMGQLVNNTTQKIGAAQTTSTITMTATEQDLTGTSLTFSVAYACRIMIVGIFDCDMNGTATAAGVVFVGVVNVDGTSIGGTSGEAHLNAGRATAPQQWIVDLTAGSHTIKLRGKVTAATGISETNAGHTKWHAWVPSP